jgi:hypothetical protein
MHTMRVMKWKYVARVVALAGVSGLLAMSAPASWGAPDDPGTEADSPTLALSDLGSGSVLTFWGQEATLQLTVPVPLGLTPAALNATVQLPLNLRSGMMTVTQGDKTISKLNLPTTDGAPLVIPLVGVELVDNSATVLLHSYLQQAEGNSFCDHSSPLRLFDGTVSFAGVELPPDTVAHFLPSVLRKLTIFMPQTPSTAESDAVIRLAAAAAEHYFTQNPEIAVVPLSQGQAAPPTRSRPLERQIVVKEGPDNGLSLQGTAHRWMLVSGPLLQTDESDTAVLFGDLSQLALAPKAAVQASKFSPPLPGNTATLRELGQPAFNNGALQPRVSIGVDQTRWGRSVHSVRVHLLGSYTPGPSNSGGQIVAKVGTETIDHWPIDGQGVIDRWVDVPDRLLQRYTNLDVALNVSGNIGPCGDFTTVGSGSQLLTLAISGDSTVQSSPAAPPVPDGLQSLPQALMPRLQVGIEAHSFDDTVRAVNIVVGLQRMSSIPLDTTVTTVQEAIDSSNPAILIAANGWSHSDIALPVSAGSSGPITVNAVEFDGKPVTLAVDPTLRFASLQTVFNRGRSLLIATSNGAPAQLDELLRWLTADQKRWFGLKGVAQVSVAGHDPVAVERTNLGGPAAEPQSHSNLGWLWWIAGGWIAAAIIGTGVIVLRNRRRSHRS